MARETKVGLLVGLAFIICFAVILANRGRDDTAASAGSVLSDAGSRVVTSLQDKLSRGIKPNPAQEPARHSAGVPTPTTGSELVLQEGAGPAGMQPPAASTPTLPRPPAGDGAVRTPLGPPVSPEVSDRTLASHIPAPAVSGFELQNGRSGAPPSGGVVSTGTQPPPSGKSESDSANASPGSSYTVASGDTLSKIAIAHYGNKSRSTVNAVFQANRKALENPDSLRAGLVLALPNLAGASRPNAAEPPKPATTRPKAETAKVEKSKKPADPPASGFRWYQVQKDDRLVSIAREQLGDGGRWKELHEMNKDKFPDPQKIREGVRIKLPAAKGMLASEGRR